MGFKGKSIFLISPQSWNSIKISKHHYAESLSLHGAKVFFINPPASTKWPRLKFEWINKNLCVIDFSFLFHNFIKFHASIIYQQIIKVFLKNIIKRVGQPDILWNFDNTFFFTQEFLFKNSYKIFHPVDMFPFEKARKYNNLYDIIFSPSLAVLEKIYHINKHFINHGLGEDIAEFAKKLNYIPPNFNKPNLTVGYLGNISISVLNRHAFIDLIKTFRNIKFTLIGEIDEFCAFQRHLRTFENVFFTGRKNGIEKMDILNECDILLICYDYVENVYHCDNTHKILEYLSVGKVIICSPLSVYKNYKGIINFIDFSKAGYLKEFEKVINNYQKYSNANLFNRRRDLALDNTYTNQILKIEQILY